MHADEIITLSLTFKREFRIGQLGQGFSQKVGFFLLFEPILRADILDNILAVSMFSSF